MAVRGPGGYLCDLYDLALQRFVNPRSYWKYLAIRKLARESGARVFIEAGTYRGTTAWRCAGDFERIYTIELDTNLANAAKQFLAMRKNVTVIEGDALKVIPSLMAGLKDERPLIFLDGHYSGGVTACGDLPEPAVEELTVLAEYRDRIAAIIIDDFRAFGVARGYPSKSQLLHAAEEIFQQHGFDLRVHLDQVLIWRPAAR